MNNYLFISDAAKEVKVESHVLRYWEEELHLPIKRNELGHRYYTEEDVERFKQIKGMKERGLQLKAIKMILKDGKLDMLVPKEKGGQDTEQNESADRKQNAVEEAEPDVSRNNVNNYIQGARQDHVKGMIQDTMCNTLQNMGQAPVRPTGRNSVSDNMAIDVVESKETTVSASDGKEEKSRRLQWLLQQLIRETLQENNSELCREIKESVVKELDYQFRMQEEREEARDKLMEERSEEYYQRMDELLRKKAKKRGLRAKAQDKDKAEEKAEDKTKFGKAKAKDKGKTADRTEEDLDKEILELAMENIPGDNLSDIKAKDKASKKADKKKRHFIF
jgi:DNA-binding transcriptional MerR regulator